MNRKGKVKNADSKESDFFSVSGSEELGKKNAASGFEFRAVNVSPKLLSFNSENPYRELSREDYERLKEDIRKRGIVDPLITDQENILLTGHSRLKAALELGLETVPVRKLVSSVSSEERYRIMLLDNLIRRQLSPAEKIEFIRKAYGKELEKDNRGGNRKSKGSGEPSENAKPEKINTVKKIAQETGMSESTVKRAVAEIKGKSKGSDEPSEKVQKEKKPPKITQKRMRELDEIRDGERFREDGVLEFVYQIRKDRTAKSGYSLFREYKYDVSTEKIGQILERNDEFFIYELRSLGFCQNVTVKFSRLYKMFGPYNY